LFDNVKVSRKFYTTTKKAIYFFRFLNYLYVNQGLNIKQAIDAMRKQKLRG